MATKGVSCLQTDAAFSKCCFTFEASSICCNKGHPETSMDCIMRKFREEGALGGAVESFMN